MRAPEERRERRVGQPRGEAREREREERRGRERRVGEERVEEAREEVEGGRRHPERERVVVRARRRQRQRLRLRLQRGRRNGVQFLDVEAPALAGGGGGGVEEDEERGGGGGEVVGEEEEEEGVVGGGVIGGGRGAWWWWWLRCRCIGNTGGDFVVEDWRGGDRSSDATLTTPPPRPDASVRSRVRRPLAPLHLLISPRLSNFPN